MQIVTVGSRVFVTSFQLAGVQGVIVESPEKALVEITRLMNDSTVGLVFVSDDISKTIGNKLTELRSMKSTPLVFELPAPGSQKGEVDYRLLLKQILGV
ncbi:MAG: V-type ATP synthase subunit F [Thaumarchaeota archaeon]|nr:V-type ATP synthase subunit F [Nitrososphaerota archaeon]